MLVTHLQQVTTLEGGTNRLVPVCNTTSTPLLLSSTRWHLSRRGPPTQAPDQSQLSSRIVRVAVTSPRSIPNTENSSSSSSVSVPSVMLS